MSDGADNSDGKNGQTGGGVDNERKSDSGTTNFKRSSEKMAVTYGTGDIPKVKGIIVTLSGFGDADGNVECTQVGLPDTAENESVEIPTNQRDYKDATVKKTWDDFGKLRVVNDAKGANFAAFADAKMSGLTGTITINPGGTWTGIVSKVEGPEGSADGFASDFTPTFTIVSGTATAKE